MKECALFLFLLPAAAIAEPQLNARVAAPSSALSPFNQLISWCCYLACAEKGGELSVFASVFVGDHIRMDNKLPCVCFGPGAKGAAAANVECRKILTIEADPLADVKIGINGITKQTTEDK